MVVRLLHVSDVETAYDDPERVGRLAGAIRRRDGPDALVAGSGDTTGPSVLALREAGAQALPFFERVGTAVDVPGNHDLDHGLGAAAELFERSPQTWIAANVRTAGTPLEGIADRRLLEVVDACAAETTSGDATDSTTIGVTGVTTPSLPAITPPASDLEIAAALPAAAEAVDGLRDDGADVVVLLAHLRDPQRFARELDVDAVLAGHVHEELADVVDGVPITRPAVRGESVYEVTLDDEPAIDRIPVRDAPVDAVVADALRDRERSAGLLEPVATVTEPIARTSRTFHDGESRVGNFVADAYRWRGDADVGLQNGAGLREGQALSGSVTVGDLIGIVPFESDLVVATLTGEQLRAVCSEASPQVGDALPDGNWNAHWSGVEGVWDADATAFESLTVDGEPVDPTATYEVATSEYLLDTTHEFPTLCEATKRRRFGTQYDALVEYAREEGVDPVLDGRLVFV